MQQQQGNGSSSTEVLGSEQAFVLTPPAPSAIKTEGTRQLLQLHWRIEPGYYLYRDQLKLSDAQGQSLTLNIPQGQTLTDAFFGTVQVFHDELRIEAALPQRSEQWPLQLQWQGCAHAGVCYPPQQQSISAQQLGQLAGAEAPSIDSAVEAIPISTPSPSWLQSLALPASVLIGPMALPTMALALFLAMLLSQWWARRQQLRLEQAVDALLMRSFLVGLLAARLAYVGQWWQEYLLPATHSAASVLQIVDIRDGGWNLWAGLAAAAAWTLWRARRNTALRRATLQALRRRFHSDSCSRIA